MAWDTTLPNRLRYMIGDIGATQDYTDLQLKQFVVIAASAVIGEVDLGSLTITVDTDSLSISPDPITDSSVDVGIPNLIVLRAACILTRAEMRKDVAKYGVKIKDHLTQYDGSLGMNARLAAAKDFCKMYEDAAWDWQAGNISAVRAVLDAYSFEGDIYSSDLALDWNDSYDANSRVT